MQDPPSSPTVKYGIIVRKYVIKVDTIIDINKRKKYINRYKDNYKHRYKKIEMKK